MTILAVNKIPASAPLTATGILGSSTKQTTVSTSAAANSTLLSGVTGVAGLSFGFPLARREIFAPGTGSPQL
ncbi:MAG TPA: hypothetical protein VME17_24900 [Bryobacteraceae bacterium]|nr:hypothetical protein [Bryobacteraceae bacterium]